METTIVISDDNTVSPVAKKPKSKVIEIQSSDTDSEQSEPDCTTVAVHG